MGSKARLKGERRRLREQEGGFETVLRVHDESKMSESQREALAKAFEDDPGLKEFYEGLCGLSREGYELIESGGRIEVGRKR
jgi:hypothetical protein